MLGPAFLDSVWRRLSRRTLEVCSKQLCPNCCQGGYPDEVVGRKKGGGRREMDGEMKY